MKPGKNSAALYDEYYFQHGCGIPYERNEHWLKFFGDIAEAIVQKISPRTVLDAGCAMGFLVEALRQRGVQAWGIDVSEYALRNVHPDIQSYCTLGSVTDSLSRKYDLIVCIEVLEHLTGREAEGAAKNLCDHSDDVLFSSTPSDYKEATHFNVQPPEYWAELFAHQNFFHDLDFDASFITPWAMRFRRKNERLHDVVRNYERKFWLLRKENLDLRSLNGEMRDRLASDEKAARQLTLQLEEKNQAIQTLDGLVTGKERAIQTLDGLVAEKEQAIRALNASIVEKEQAAQGLSVQVADKERALQSLQMQITEILNSRSWRIMKLFRNIRLGFFPPNTK